MRLRLVIALRGLRRAKAAARVGYVILAIAILGLTGGMFFGSWALLNFLRSPQFAEYTSGLADVFSTLPVLMLAAAFLGILLTSFGVLLQALYLSGDMDFLLASPVPIRAVFVAKLLQAVLPNFGLTCLFLLPISFGLAASAGYNFLFYLFMPLVLAGLALAAAGISALLVMGIVRLFPARRVAEVVGFVGAISAFLCSQSGQIANWGSLVEDNAPQAYAAAAQINTPWMPLAWAGRGLIAIGEGRWLSGFALTTVTLALCAGVFALALLTAERLYYNGWANIQVSTHKKKSAARKTAPPGQPARGAAALAGASGLFERAIPAAVRAIFVKDLLVLRRDLRNMSQLVTPLILGIIYAVSLLRSGNQVPLGQGNAPEWFVDLAANVFTYADVFISLFVGWMLLGRLAGVGFSQEGKSYWLLKTSPVGTGKLITAKFLVAYAPAILLSVGFLAVIWLLRNPSIGAILFSLPVVALCTAGNAGITLAFGILGTNLNWENPQQMQKGYSGCLGAMASMLYLPLCFGLFFGPLLLTGLLQLPALLGQLAGLAAGGVFCLLCAIAPPWAARRQVEKLGED
jgi:ABC-2 type transport system permease protein